MCGGNKTILIFSNISCPFLVLVPITFFSLAHSPQILPGVDEAYELQGAERGGGKTKMNSFKLVGSLGAFFLVLFSQRRVHSEDTGHCPE